MFQNLVQKLFVFAIKNGSLRGIVYVQQLEQNAENDGNQHDQIHLAFEMLLTCLHFNDGNDLSPAKLYFGLTTKMLFDVVRASEREEKVLRERQLTFDKNYLEENIKSMRKGGPIFLDLSGKGPTRPNYVTERLSKS